MPALLLRVLFAGWAVCVFCIFWCWAQRGTAISGVLRIALWALAMFVAMLPALHASGADYDFDLSAMANATNAAGFYRDFFFITVVASILGLSSILDHIFKQSMGIGIWSKLVLGMLGVYFIGVVVYGVNRFGDIAKVKSVISFGHDLSIMKYTLAAGALAELAIVIRDRTPRRNAGTNA